jgi:hypothetical protein
VHLFRPSLGFLVEAQPRLKTGEDQKANISLGKLQIYFVSTLFK